MKLMNKTAVLLGSAVVLAQACVAMAACRDGGCVSPEPASLSLLVIGTGALGVRYLKNRIGKN